MEQLMTYLFMGAAINVMLMMITGLNNNVIFVVNFFFWPASIVFIFFHLRFRKAMLNDSEIAHEFYIKVSLSKDYDFESGLITVIRFYKDSQKKDLIAIENVIGGVDDEGFNVVIDRYFIYMKGLLDLRELEE